MSYQTLPEARKAPSLASVLLNGRVLTVDPASGGSSMPGYAVTIAGQFVENGELRIPKGSLINYRLHELHKALCAVTEAHGPFDMLIIEDIPIVFGTRGRGAKGSKGNPHGGAITPGIINLHWSCGVILAAQPWPHVVKVAPQSWHSWVRQVMNEADYVKSDSNDALVICLCVFHQLVGRLPDGASLDMLKV